MFFTAPLMGALSVKIGSRKCVLGGAMITAVSLLLAIPAFSINYMAITLGGLVGELYHNFYNLGNNLVRAYLYCF